MARKGDDTEEENKPNDAGKASKLSSSEGTALSRPRPDNADDSKPAKRRRGRPPKEPSGNNSVDRRRKRVREATQALRIRKRLEVRSMRERVVTLENAMGQISSLFVDFREFLLEHETILEDPAMVRRLKQVTENFLSVARSTSKGKESELAAAPGDAQDIATAAVGVSSGSATPSYDSMPMPSLESGASGLQLRLDKPLSRDILSPFERAQMAYNLDSLRAFVSRASLISPRDFVLLNDPLADTALTQQPELWPKFLGENISFVALLLRENLTLAWNSLRGVSESSLNLAKSMFRFTLLHRSINELLTGIRYHLRCGADQHLYPDGEAERYLINAIEEALQLRGQTEGDYVNYKQVEEYLERKGAFSIDSKTVKLLVQSPALADESHELFSGGSDPIEAIRATNNQREHTETLDAELNYFEEWTTAPALLDTPGTIQIPNRDYVTTNLTGIPQSSWEKSVSRVPSQTQDDPGEASPEYWNVLEPSMSQFQVVTLDSQRLVRNLSLMSVCLGRGPAYLPFSLDRAMEASRIREVC